MKYVDWIVDPGSPPANPPVAAPWLLTQSGQAFLKGIGLALDDNADRARQAVIASFPLYCPADALAAIGQEVGMPRGVNEPEANYRGRLVDPWSLWQLSGSAYGLLVILYAVGYKSVVLQTQLGQQITLSPSYDPNNRKGMADLVISPLSMPVHLGGNPELWSQFAILITQPWPTWWNGVAPSATSSDAQMFVSLAKAWKSAHSEFVKVEVVDGPTWGFPGVDWSGFTWGSGTVVTWIPEVTWGSFNWGDGTEWTALGV